MTKEEVELYKPGSKLHLVGYTSTSTELSVAKGFALKNLGDDKIPVIFKIHFKGHRGLFAMTHEYSAYPEDEVLVQDGLEYKVTGIEYMN